MTARFEIWGYVDHANLYRDTGMKAILGEWWSGDGPSAINTTCSGHWSRMLGRDVRPGIPHAK